MVGLSSRNQSRRNIRLSLPKYVLFISSGQVIRHATLVTCPDCQNVGECIDTSPCHERVPIHQLREKNSKTTSPANLAESF
jgi:hypothetical protein